jgi:cbb3-type cytochrome oxidase subunit 3
MYQEFLAKSGLLVWPLIGLLIFVTIFAGILGYVIFGLRDKKKVDEIAALPLEDDTYENGHADGRAT